MVSMSLNNIIPNSDAKSHYTNVHQINFEQPKKQGYGLQESDSFPAEFKP